MLSVNCASDDSAMCEVWTQVKMLGVKCGSGDGVKCGSGDSVRC